jgi:hypothetical protein
LRPAEQPTNPQRTAKWLSSHFFKLSGDIGPSPSHLRDKEHAVVFNSGQAERAFMLKAEVESCIRGEGNPGDVAPRCGRLNAVEERYGVLTTKEESFCTVFRRKSCQRPQRFST